MPTWFVERHKPLVTTAVLLWVMGFIGFFALVIVYDLDFLGPVGGPWVLAYATFVVTGALIAWQRPDHLMGPLFVILGVVVTLANGTSAAVLGVFAEHPLQLRALIAGVGAAAGTATFTLLAVAVVTYPDGRLPSVRWRWMWPMCAVTTAVGATSAFLVGAWAGEATEAIVGPPFEGMPDAIGQALAPIYNSLLLVLMSTGVTALVVRYLRSDGTVRRQIRWLAVAAAFLILIIAVVVVTDFTAEVLTNRAMLVAANVTVAAGVALVPVSVTIAILRHRLFDIDLVISRSLVLAALAGFIAVVYVTVVVGVGQVIGRGDQPQLGLQVVATAIVAVAFQPLRIRARRFADRLVLGHRATPYEVLAGFSRQAVNAGDDAMLQRVAELLAAGTGAQPAVVWLRVGNELRPAAISGEVAEPSTPLNVEAIADLGASLTVPVHHEGEMLGAVTLTKPNSEPPSQQDEELTTRLASGLSLVLRNAWLTAELKEHLRELEASRQRIIHVQDDARRKIERDLHAGAQQRLAEFGQRLGEVRAAAVASGAARIAGLLAQLDGDIGDAVATLNDLARGIYPPLLESDGLARALTEQAKRSPVPVSVHAAGVMRHDRHVEGAVYFCVLEALQNAAKYADATSVHVSVEQDEAAITFDVADDGAGFDPDHVVPGSGLRGMADRLDAVGGQLEVHSRPGAGTRVCGRVPLDVHEPRAGAPAPAAAEV